jgi:leucyl aminopeptidase
MRIVSLAPGALPSDVVAVGVPVSSHEDGPRLAAPVGELAELDQLPAVLDPAWCKRHGFTGKVGQTLAFRTTAPPSAAATGTGPSGQAPRAEGRAAPAATAPPPDIILVGVGDLPALVGDGGLESLRRATAAFIRTVGQGAAGFVMPDLNGLLGDAALPGEPLGAAVAEGAALAVYRYDDFRTGESPGQPSVLVIAAAASGDAASLDAGIARGARIAESVCVARDLVNEPPSSLTPARFAEFFVERFDGVPGLSVEVWDEERIAAERLGGLLGVARGSVVPPRLVRVEYQPADPIEEGGRVPHLALVGKGITFDSGGLSLKTAGGMETMKTDMGGAAAVLSAMDAAAALGSRIRITALAPLTENMPSGSATKPGDVLTARNGKTIEVLNTDAEGRLVLADGLSLAVESGADAIVDLATLTGAAVVALGKEIAGLLGNDSELIAQVRSAGERAGEPLWPLPLPDDYRTHIDSEIADMRNVGRPGQAGSISAALLLREFVGSVPWAHLDIAGPSRSDEHHRYLAKGGTGFGVRTLVALVTSEAFAHWLARAGGG